MVLLASAYERSGSIELAEKEYADATKTSAFNVPVTLNYVAFLRRRGSPERAEDVLTELARRWPNNVRGFVYFSGRQTSAAKLGGRPGDCRNHTSY